MARLEKTGFRCQEWSYWHRNELPDDMDFLDIDWVEYCHLCKKPLALFELARDYEQKYKIAYVTQNLARMAGIPGYVILYKIDKSMPHNMGDCRIQQLWPLEQKIFKAYPPHKVREGIIRLHNNCKCQNGD